MKNRTLFIRDNLEVLRGLPDKSVDLIYLDPPFNSNRTYSAPVGSEAAGAAFKDTWTLSDTDNAWHGQLSESQPKLYEMIHAIGVVNGSSHKSYLIYMAMRLIELHRVLKDTGSIYLHCDQTMSHSLKLVMDSIFGRENFLNEIVWCYKSGGIPKRNLSKKHDVIFWYSKRKNKHIYNKQYAPYSEGTLQRGLTNYKKNLGNYSLSKKGANMTDWWNDIKPILSPTCFERTGYPTQKPLALLERIIKASCPEGGIVLDPFCGCATACIAAEKLGRQWIGIDLSEKAGELVKIRAKSELGQLKLFPSKITIRKTLPVRGAPKPSKNIKHDLYGIQEGCCAGCGHHFQIRNMEIDHIIPRSKGGPDTDLNLQLLCPNCNRVKGARIMADLWARLKKNGINILWEIVKLIQKRLKERENENSK